MEARIELNWYNMEKKRLLGEIERNKRLKCYLVAKRFQRELDRLEKQHNDFIENNGIQQT